MAGFESRGPQKPAHQYVQEFGEQKWLCDLLERTTYISDRMQ